MALQSDNLILRQETNAPNTTKGAELTFEELDNNFIFIYEDLKALQGSGALPAWVVSTTYSLNTVVSYDGFIWKYVNASPSAGVVPGSDPLFWLQMVPTELTHLQNSDTKLAEGTVDEVTANEIRTFLDTPIVSDNLYNADGTITDPIRVVDLDGNEIRFQGGAVRFDQEIGIGAAPVAGYGAYINALLAGVFSYSLNGKGGIFQSTNSIALEVGSTNLRGVVSSGNDYGVVGVANGFGLYGYGNGAGAWGVFALQNGGTSGALYVVGQNLIEDGSSGSISASALVQMKSTSKGAVNAPVMTSAQKNAIAAPATGLHVFDSDFARDEVFNGSYWEGESITLNVQAAQSNPSSGATIFFGNLALQPATTGGTRKIFVRKKRVIRGAELYSRASTAGSNEAWLFYIRVNDTTDYLIQSVGVSANERIWTNMALSIELNPGDYFEIKGVNPTWGTPPASFTIAGNILLQ